jgi:hypothetical protein
MVKWPDFYFPPINLWCYPKQNEDYKMITEETTVKPLWRAKEPLIPITKEFLEEAISMGLGTSKPIKHDPVNSPSHYTFGGVETIDYIEAKGLDKDFCLANVIKYVSRAGYKISKLEDLKKAQYYLNRRIKILEASEE